MNVVSRAVPDSTPASVEILTAFPDLGKVLCYLTVRLSY